MSVIDKQQPKGYPMDLKLAKVCDENGIGIFSVRELGNGNKDRMQVIIRMDEEQGYVVSCNCRYFWSFNLFCSHSFAVFNLLQIRTLEKFEPFSRWTKRFHAGVYRDETPDVDIDAMQGEALAIEALSRGRPAITNAKNGGEFPRESDQEARM